MLWEWRPLPPLVLRDSRLRYVHVSHDLCFSVLVFFSPILLWFVILGLFGVELIVLTWDRTCFDPFHWRSFSKSSQAHRSGHNSSFEEEKPVFIAWFKIRVNWLNFEWWSFRDSSPTILWSSSQNLMAVGFNLDITAGWFFAECLKHSAKAKLHSAKPLPSATLGKELRRRC